MGNRLRRICRWHLRTHIRIAAIAFGAAIIPVVIWFTWSQLTFSALLPNTFLAKSNLEIPQKDLLIQGFKYFLVSAENDPITFIAILAAITAALILGNKVLRAWSLGIILYLSYALWIGGDFMAGRFFSLPLLFSAAILISIRKDFHIRFNTALLAIITMLQVAVAMDKTPVALSNTNTQRWVAGANSDIVDGRSFYVRNNRDLNYYINNFGRQLLNGEFTGVTSKDPQIRSLNEINNLTKNWPLASQQLTKADGVLTECGLLDTIGIALGPRNHLIDSCALTDRFLADLPFTPNSKSIWKSGH